MFSQVGTQIHLVLVSFHTYILEEYLQLPTCLVYNKNGQLWLEALQQKSNVDLPKTLWLSVLKQMLLLAWFQIRYSTFSS